MPEKTPLPCTFSIIIPTYKRPDRLVECIRSLAGLNYDRRHFEVIVVDDGSGTLAQVEEVLRPLRDKIEIRLIEQPHAGPAAARNFGARQAAFEYLAFTDDDCRLDPEWLAAYSRQFAVSPHCLAGGDTINALADNIYSQASQLLVSYLYGYYQTKGAPFLASNNIALSRTLFDQLHGFDERFPLAGGEDRDFCARAVQEGHELAFVPGAIVHHFHALSLRRFIRQHKNYGRGALFFHKVNADRGGGKIKLEPLKFYTDLISYPYKVPGAKRRLRLCLLMIVSQAANAFGFFYEKGRRLLKGQK